MYIVVDKEKEEMYRKGLGGGQLKKKVHRGGSAEFRSWGEKMEGEAPSPTSLVGEGGDEGGEVGGDAWREEVGGGTSSSNKVEKDMIVLGEERMNVEEMEEVEGKKLEGVPEVINKDNVVGGGADEGGEGGVDRGGRGMNLEELLEVEKNGCVPGRSR